MLGNLNGIHLLVLVLVILLLFGAPKLPALARSMGQSMRIFRKEVQTLNSEKAADTQAAGLPGAEAGAEGVPASGADAPVAAPLKH
jgi:sec-independent protein translocase protein TatA